MKRLHATPSAALLSVVTRCILALALSFSCSVVAAQDASPAPASARNQSGTTRIAGAAAPLVARHPGKSGFYPLHSGLDAFLARAELIQAAEKTLDIQYYIFNNDLTGRILAGMLLDAANRGVRVRVLLDDMYLAGRDRNLASFAAHPNIRIRVFNAFKGRGKLSRVFDCVTDLSRVQHRMHNKMLVADGAAGVVGGRNIGDEYFAASEGVNFGDMDLFAIGPVLKTVEECFDRYWSSSEVTPVENLMSPAPTASDLTRIAAELTAHRNAQKESQYLVRLRDSDLMKRLTTRNLSLCWGRAFFTYDLPDKITSRGLPPASVTWWARLFPYVNETRSELLLVTPYFVPGDHGVSSLKSLRDRGVRVRVVTNSLAANDEKVVHGAYACYRKDLLRDGIEIYEVKGRIEASQNKEAFGKTDSGGAMLHAKTMIFDRRVVFVGSANLDPRSRNLNTEMGLVVESPELASYLGGLMDRRIPQCCFRLSLVPNQPFGPDGREYGDKIVWYGEVNGRRVQFMDEPETGLWRKASTKVGSFFVPESFL